MRYTINLGNGTGRYAEIVGSVELQLHHDYKPGVDGPTVPKLREIVRRELSDLMSPNNPVVVTQNKKP